MKVIGGIVNPDAVKSAQGDALAISLGEDPSSITIWTLLIDARTDEGRVRVGRVQSRPPSVTGGPPSRLVAVAQFPGAREWYVTAIAARDDGTGVIPVAEIALAATECCSALPAGVTSVDAGVSGDWTLADLGSRLEAWWTAREGVLLTGAAVDGWRDKTFKRNHLARTAAGSLAYVTDAFGPGIQFDGTKVLLVSTGGQLVFERTDPFAFWWVGTTTGSGNYGVAFKGNTSATCEQFLSALGGGLAQFNLFTQTGACAVQWSLSRDVPHAVLIEYDGSRVTAGVRVTQDGVTVSPTIVQNNLDATLASSARFGLGGMNPDASPINVFAGIMRESAFVRGELDPGERVRILLKQAEWLF